MVQKNHIKVRFGFFVTLSWLLIALTSKKEFQQHRSFQEAGLQSCSISILWEVASGSQLLRPFVFAGHAYSSETSFLLSQRLHAKQKNRYLKIDSWVTESEAASNLLSKSIRYYAKRGLPCISSSNRSSERSLVLPRMERVRSLSLRESWGDEDDRLIRCGRGCSEAGLTFANEKPIATSRWWWVGNRAQ